tara:strand:+ start:3759 stop:3998 length:240 start_codon:yes stop_codon:yes gene_type:complete
MEIENSENARPLEILANISEQFTLFEYKRLLTEVKIKLGSGEYMMLMREVENISHVGSDPNSKTFSIDIDGVKFIFSRD